MYVIIFSLNWLDQLDFFMKIMCGNFATLIISPCILFQISLIRQYLVHKKVLFFLRLLDM